MHWVVKLANSLHNDSSFNKHVYIHTICQIAIALCVCTVLLSSFMIRGFEQKIEQKIFNFWSHIRIFPLSTSTQSIIDIPIAIEDSLFNKINRNPEVAKILPVANRGAILRAPENIEGVILRGLHYDSNSSDYNFTNEQNLPYSPEELSIIPSQTTLQRLNLKIGDKLLIHIIDSHSIVKKARIINSYFTNIEEFDQQIALTNITFIQSLNHWKSNEYSWIEVQAKNEEQIEFLAKDLYQHIDGVNVESVYKLFPQIFDWLALMKKNELIILVVMLVVAIINVMSTISIFVLEKTQIIGLLKVLGVRNRELSYLFFYQVSRIILKGFLFGNLLTLILTAIIHYLKPIRLDPEIYYIDYAPISIDWGIFILLNLLIVIVCILTSWIPLMTISRISPVKVVEYR